MIWIVQRRGRAGRVQPGECYHLYPRCVYDSFSDYQLPELLRTPLQSLCLQIKSLQLGSITEFLSQALQPPEPLSVHHYLNFAFYSCSLPKVSHFFCWQVQNAVEYLKIIGALDEHENLTVLGMLIIMASSSINISTGSLHGVYNFFTGRHLSMLPVEPKLGKMLIYGAIFNCLDPIMTVVAGLSGRDPFVMPLDKKDVSVLFLITFLDNFLQ